MLKTITKNDIENHICVSRIAECDSGRVLDMVVTYDKFMIPRITYLVAFQTRMMTFVNLADAVKHFNICTT